ncbi:restriction endonuclease subunit S [Staphylococcus hominis]|uniref:restriction endonuclease subunit S n=1 Tax=Staphylococcus hominis TaxID=1290 RepID=UPI00287A2DD3|nr:restriction endonuclease subunit S [Staphylococcus hominis]MDS3887515.1 restriction endonuclease subunit S [Staphylococcus hominis]
MEYNKFKFKDLFEISHGYPFKSSDFSNEKTNFYVMTPGNVKIGGGIKLDKIKYLRKDTEFDKNYIFKPNDIFINMTDLSKKGDTLGFPAIIPDDINNFYLHNQRLGRILNINEYRINKNYLFYLLCTREYRHHILSSATGSTVKHTSPKRILEFEVSLPNLNIQKYIGGLLNKIDKKIIINKNIIANLEELSQTLFKRWFVDFEFPDKDGNPYKSSGGEMIDSELGKIPLNWNVNVLKNIADVRTGYAFKSSEYIYSSKLSVLRTLNISKTSCLIEMNNLKFVSNDYINIPKYNKYSLEIFDTLLVTVGGSIGNIGIITESNLPSLQNQNMWRFRTLNSKINNLLIYNIIKIINKNVSNQTSGSAREFYTKKVFENFKIALPNLNHPMLLKANQIHSNLFKNISNLNKETNNLVKLRDTLLPKLMSGEIEIPDDIEVNTDELSF